MREILYIAAKAPRMGLAKTRLGQAIGHAAAIALYRAFLCDLAARFAQAPFALGWYVTPADAWHDIAPLFEQSTRMPQVLVQADGDWTERQRMLFRTAAERGEDRVILIASDSPQITVATVTRAFRALDRHDVVFGPVADGGYYLIGMRGWHDILHGVPMSTGTVLHDLIARAAQAGLAVALVETMFDIDEIGDLAELRRLAAARDDLCATRAALAACGAPGLIERANDMPVPG
jgi:rSAM/selenodomain-associated transferase 1